MLLGLGTDTTGKSQLVIGGRMLVDSSTDPISTYEKKLDPNNSDDAALLERYKTYSTQSTAPTKNKTAMPYPALGPGSGGWMIEAPYIPSRKDFASDEAYRQFLHLPVDVGKEPSNQTQPLSNDFSGGTDWSAILPWAIAAAAAAFLIYKMGGKK